MTKELKPCVNDMCPMWDEKHDNNCIAHKEFQWITKEDYDIQICTCKKYTTEKIENKYKKMWEKCRNEISFYLPSGLLNRIEKALDK